MIPPRIECEQHHTILMVPDVDEAVGFYTTKLGFWCAFRQGNPPAFAGVNLGHAQIFLEKGKPGSEGCALYFVVGNADELHDFHRSNGVEIGQSIDDRDYRLRDYTVRDLNGYSLTFGHRLGR